MIQICTLTRAKKIHRLERFRSTLTFSRPQRSLTTTVRMGLPSSKGIRWAGKPGETGKKGSFLCHFPAGLDIFKKSSRPETGRSFGVNIFYNMYKYYNYRSIVIHSIFGATQLNRLYDETLFHCC